MNLNGETPSRLDGLVERVIRRAHERGDIRAVALVGRFRSVRLNAAGWSVLVAFGAALGGVISIALRTPPTAAMPLGIATSWAAARVWDQRRWANSTTSLSRDDLAEQDYELALERLRSIGVSATTSSYWDEGVGDIQWAIRCRNADLEAAQRVLDDLAGSP